MTKYYHGVAIVLLSTLCSALMPSFAKFAYSNNLTVMTLLFFRFSLSAVMIFSFLLISKENIRLDRKTLLGLFFIGAVFYTLQAATYFSSLKYIPASLAILISYTYPAFTAIVTCLWDHEPLTKRIVFSLICTFGGLILMLSTTLGKINFFGAALALGAALFYTAYVVLSNKILEKVPPLVTSSYITLFSVVGIIILSLFSTEKISFAFSAPAWPWIWGVAIFSMLTIISFFKGLEILGPTKASILSTSEPIFCVVLAMIIFQERLSGMQLLGAAAVIAGAMIAVYAPPDELKQLPPVEPDFSKSA